MWRYFLFFGALTLVQGLVEGQAYLRLQITATDYEEKDDSLTFPDSLAAVAYLEEWLADQRGRAYWEASVDSLIRRDSFTLRAVLHRGKPYGWASLTQPTDKEHQGWLKRAGFRPSRFASRPLRPEAWTSVRDSTLVRAADAGYPFASIGLTDVAWSADQQLSATINLQTGPLIRIGKVRAPESARIRTVFLERYLGLPPGEPYRERRIRRMGANLRQLPYLNVKGSPRISFEDSLAFIDLPLEKRAASRFDFVIGVLPNSAQNNGNLLITGELNGELQNGFGQGERIALRFEQLRPQTQELELGLEYPFLFGLPFGFEGELDLYRRDTSFLNLDYKVAATYLREGNDRLSAFWENRRTIVPGQTAGEQGSVSTSDTSGVVRSFFGLQARRTRTDRRFSPRRGYAVDVSAAAGIRRLTDLPPGDSLAGNSGQAQLAASLDLYLDPLAGTVIYFGLRGAGIFSGDELLPNEQFRIGGAKLLRGFDEQSIFARDYLVATAEFRLLLGGNAYLYSFVDAGRVNPRNKAQPDLAIDYPLGFGLGVNFDTRAGVFGLSLAVGRSNGIPLSENISSPKLHLGYVSVF
jgi:outer membrane translocation and assembly module TamA